MNLNVVKNNSIIILSLTIVWPSTGYGAIVSGIDQQFKLSKIKNKTISHNQKKSNFQGRTKSAGVSFYQKVLRQTLGSNCDLYPHDSYYAQINFKNCSKAKSILKSMSRFYMEPDAPTIGLPILLKNKVYYVDMPTNCNMY